MTTSEIIELLKDEARYYQKVGESRTAGALFNIALTILQKEKESENKKQFTNKEDDHPFSIGIF